MVSNIDENVSKVLDVLEKLHIKENTIVIFMTDNGPQQTRYVAGMRGRKGSVYNGGVRVPFYIRYPSLLKGNKEVDALTAHIDVAPTLATLCHAQLPTDRIIDGKNMLPLLMGESVDWDDRSLFFYWTRRYLELYTNIALRKGSFKLVGKANYSATPEQFELYNLNQDPYEQHNVVETKKRMSGEMKSELDMLFESLVKSDNLTNSPRIVIGSKFKNPVTLNRNDADGERDIWAQEEVYGFWRISIQEAGYYNFTFKFIQPVEASGQMSLEAGTSINKAISPVRTDVIRMNNVQLSKMDCDLRAIYSDGKKTIRPFYVEVEKIQ